MAVPKQKTGRARTHSRRSANDVCAMPSRSVCPQCGEVKLPLLRVRQLRLLQGSRGCRDRVISLDSTCTVNMPTQFFGLAFVFLGLFQCGVQPFIVSRFRNGAVVFSRLLPQ